MKPEELEQKAAEVLPAEVLSGLVSSNWKERLAAMEGFTNVSMVGMFRLPFTKIMSCLQIYFEKFGCKLSYGSNLYESLHY